MKKNGMYFFACLELRYATQELGELWSVEYELMEDDKIQNPILE